MDKHRYLILKDDDSFMLASTEIFADNPSLLVGQTIVEVLDTNDFETAMKLYMDKILDENYGK